MATQKRNALGRGLDALLSMDDVKTEGSSSINAPKELFVAETTAHYAYAEQWSAAWNWVMNFLKNKSK